MYNLVNPPFGSFVPVTTGNGQQSVAQELGSARRFGLRSVQGSQDLHPRQLWHVPQRAVLARSELLAAAAVPDRDADRGAGLAVSQFVLECPGPGSGTISIPTNGSLSITNGDFYGVYSTPYQMQWNFNIEREVMANTVATIGYIGSHNLHMFMQQDFNPSRAVSGCRAGSCFYNGRPTFASATGLANTRVNPQYNSLQMADNLGDSHYEALQTSLNRRFSSNWQAQVSYTYSKSIDNGSGTYGLDGGGIASNPLNVSADRGLSNFNRTNNFRVSGIYSVPFKVKGFVGQVVNGWQLTGVFTYLSGAPANPTSAHESRVHGHRTECGPPECQSRDAISIPDQPLHGLWFNPNCFSPAAHRYVRQTRGATSSSDPICGTWTIR